MTVKWVCDDCSSNNLGEFSVLLQCGVCGKLRTTETLTNVNTEIVDVTGIEKRKVRLSQNRGNYVRLLYILFGQHDMIMVSFFRAAMLGALAFLGIYFLVSGILMKESFIYVRDNIIMLIESKKCCNLAASCSSLVQMTCARWSSHSIFLPHNAFCIDNIGIAKKILMNHSLADYLENWRVGIGINCAKLDVFRDNWIINSYIVMIHIQQYCLAMLTNLQSYWNQVMREIFDLKDEAVNKVRNIL